MEDCRGERGRNYYEKSLVVSAINSAFKEKKEKKERKMKEKNHYYLRDTKLLDF